MLETRIILATLTVESQFLGFPQKKLFFRGEREYICVTTHNHHTTRFFYGGMRETSYYGLFRSGCGGIFVYPFSIFSVLNSLSLRIIIIKTKPALSLEKKRRFINVFFFSATIFIFCVAKCLVFVFQPPCQCDW